MDYLNGLIKVYQRNIKRKLKDGTEKTYKTFQHQVLLKENDLFQDNQEVAVIGTSDLIELISFYKSSKNEMEDLKKSLELYRKDTEKLEKAINDLDRLRNKHDHLQERLRKALEEINQQQKVISDLSNRGFFDYITGKLPESYKLLNKPED